MGGKLLLPEGGFGRLPGRRFLWGVEISPAPPVQSAEEAETADQRLIIETSESGQTVYVLVEGRTGKVLSRHTVEDIERLIEDPSYSAGRLFDGKA